jgi:multiple sugar transport system substrate-binding protein
MKPRPMLTVLALALVLVLAASGCGGGGDGGQGQDNTLTFWSLEDVTDRIQKTQAIVDRFQQETGIQVKLSAIAEDQFASQIQSASAAGSLPDVVGALSLGFIHSLAADDIADADAAAEVVDSLGRETFAERALRLVEVEGKPVGIPSDTWTMLLTYRKDLFEKAGLQPPQTFEQIQAAATRLKEPGRAGIVASTKPADGFTQQTFEYLALANGCQLTDDQGNVQLTSPQCVETFRYYGDLIKNGSVSGGQDVDTTRAAYFSGKSAMLIWSSFVLDELAGLRKDALPTCAQCRADKDFLAKNSGFVTAIKGPNATQPTQFGEVTSFAIMKDGNTDAAKRFVEFMMSSGYVDWLALAPEGKIPTRAGSKDNPKEYAEAWSKLEAGVDTKRPLGEIYPAEVLQALTTSADSMARWGFEQGQGRLVGAQLNELPIPKALNEELGGQLDAEAAAKQAQADVEEIKQSVE